MAIEVKQAVELARKYLQEILQIPNPEVLLHGAGMATLNFNNLREANWRKRIENRAAE